MTIDRGLLDRIRTRGEEVFTQVSGELMSNPRFMKAMEGAMRGKEKLEEAVGQVLKKMNIPTRTEFKRALVPHRDPGAGGGRPQGEGEGRRGRRGARRAARKPKPAPAG